MPPLRSFQSTFIFSWYFPSNFCSLLRCSVSPAGALTLDFAACRTLRGKCCYFKPSSLWEFCYSSHTKACNGGTFNYFTSPHAFPTPFPPLQPNAPYGPANQFHLRFSLIRVESHCFTGLWCSYVSSWAYQTCRALTDLYHDIFWVVCAASYLWRWGNVSLLVKEQVCFPLAKEWTGSPAQVPVPLHANNHVGPLCHCHRA